MLRLFLFIGGADRSTTYNVKNLTPDIEITFTSIGVCVIIGSWYVNRGFLGVKKIAARSAPAYA